MTITTPEATFQIGARIEVTDGPQSGVPNGTVGILTTRCCPNVSGTTCWYADFENGPKHYMIFQEQVKLLGAPEPAAPESPAPSASTGETLEELRRRKERAERELQDFKDLVHQRVCEISEERNWCTDADSWLESLGLPPREVDYSELVPQGRYTVVRLNGGRLVIRKDDDSEPWHVIEGGGGYSSYLSDQDVHEEGFTTLFEGDGYY